MPWWRLHIVLVLGPMFGCDRPDRPPADEALETLSNPAESLALTGSGGTAIWYSVGRPATGPGGRPCVERGLEIRRGGERIQVPLLYTGDTPILINDSTMRATLWNNCRPVATYLVDLTTGRPVRDSSADQ